MAIKITREEYEKKFGVAPSVPAPIKQNTKQEKEQGGNFFTGLAKSAGSLLKGTVKLASQSPLFKGKLAEKAVESTEKLLPEEKLKTRGFGEKAGKLVGDVAQFAIPGTAVSKATKAASLIPRIAARAGTAGAVGAAQTGSMKGGAIAAGVEAVAPGVSKVVGTVAKPVTAFMGRLFKGISSGLSGASSQQIEAVLNNPQAAKQAVNQIKKVGGASLLRKNAETIVQGVSKIRQDARKAFGEGLEQLSKEDINPTTFRENISGVLGKYGSVVKSGQRVLQNVEFDDPKNLKKASELIGKLSKADLDGKSLRKLADDIASAKYKIATSDERLAFNALMNDLSDGLKNAISKSTNKLDEINAAFSQEMQIVEEIEKIFGKVKFKNAREILTVSQRLENLFSQKGLAPEATDKFLSKLGIESTEFRAGEAARQMGELAPAANTIGTSPFEIIRSFTSAIVPPSAVRSMAILTGLSVDILQEVATKLSPIARGTLVRALVGEQEPEPQNTQQ